MRPGHEAEATLYLRLQYHEAYRRTGHAMGRERGVRRSMMGRLARGIGVAGIALILLLLVVRATNQGRKPGVPAPPPDQRLDVIIVDDESADPADDAAPEDFRDMSAYTVVEETIEYDDGSETVFHVPDELSDPEPGPMTHVIRSGEYLSHIAKRYGVSVQDICEANGIKNRNLVKAGQKLVIPSGKKMQKPE